MHSFRKKQKGFSLIELLVAVALFSVVMTVSTGSLLSLIDASRKAQTIKSVTNNLHFALDSMTRAIRTGYDYKLNSGVLDFFDDQAVRTRYRFVNNSIERCLGNTCGWVRLTASEVTITAGEFTLTGEAPYSGGIDTNQPTVGIRLRGHAGERPSTDTEFYIQTKVTQRLIDS